MQWNQVWLGDCVELLKSVPDGSVNLVATDPPFNIGLAYDLYDDKKGYQEYQDWCQKWIAECHRVLAPNGSMYVCIGDEYAAEVNILLKKQGFHFRNWILWYYTFGENQRKKFNRCHTHILYFTKSSTEWTWNGDDIKIPSKRMLLGDKRAKPGGKIPDDVWEETSTESPELFSPCVESLEIPSDVWKISRLCGTFKERVKRADGSVHPCQMPESILERIIRASSNAGEVVLDPFGGTGTTAFVAQRLNRRFLTMDISDEYVSVIRGRLGMGADGDGLCC